MACHVQAQPVFAPVLQRSPAFMGPNALPLSWTQEPAPPKYGRIDLLWEVHRGGGDRTHNPVSYTHLTLPTNREV